MSARRPRFAVIGDPVAHSASPRLFAALSQGGQGPSLDYRAERVTAAELPEFLDRVRGGAYHGLSVTLPHKESVLALADGASEAARVIGAANCLVRTGTGQLRAENTDALGLVRALAEHGLSLSGARVLVLGAGGAARAASQASRAEGARDLFIANRTPARGQALAAHFGGVAVPLTAAALGPLLDQLDLLVQASAAGLSDPSGTALPPGCVLDPKMAVLEMVYQPLETALLRSARAAGARTIDGLWMLVHQGLEQLRLWTGQEAPAGTAGRLHRALVEGPP